MVTIIVDVPRKKIMADLQHAFVRRPDTDGFHIKSLDLEGSLQVDGHHRNPNSNTAIISFGN